MKFGADTESKRFLNRLSDYLYILVTNEPRLGIIAGLLCSGPLVLLWRNKKDAAKNKDKKDKKPAKGKKEKEPDPFDEKKEEK